MQKMCNSQKSSGNRSEHDILPWPEGVKYSEIKSNFLIGGGPGRLSSSRMRVKKRKGTESPSRAVNICTSLLTCSQGKGPSNEAAAKEQSSGGTEIR